MLTLSCLIFHPLQILNERSEKYEPPVNKSLPAGPSGVDQSKVVQALEELLEGSLISGFVSQEQVSEQIKHVMQPRVFTSPGQTIRAKTILQFHDV